MIDRPDGRVGDDGQAPVDGGGSAGAGPQGRGYHVRGRVQGVGFRWWTRRIADELGLRGSVRNLDDGSVEVHAEGGPAALDELERALARGPVTARVESVERIETDDTLTDGDFRIELR